MMQRSVMQQQAGAMQAPRRVVSIAQTPFCPVSHRRLSSIVRYLPTDVVSPPSDKKPVVDRSEGKAASPAWEGDEPAPIAAAVDSTSLDSHGESQKRGYGDAIMLQSFGWDTCKLKNWYERLVPLLPKIKEAGITHMWLPPPSRSVAPQGYMPGQLYNLNSSYGNEAQLKTLIKEMKKLGIKPIADIVINHRCADEAVDGVYNNFKDDVNHKGAKLDWNAWAITGNDPMFKGTGNMDTGEDYGPAPDLDHANPDLRAALKDWLSWLQTDIGFDGWRFDFVKGYAGEFIKEYVDATQGPEELHVGEFWADLNWVDGKLDYNQDGPRQRLVDWVNKGASRSTVFDFPLKGVLQEAVKNTEYWRLNVNGKPPGVLGWWPSKAVTFTDNHDTGSTQGHWPFPSNRMGVGYAYIMTHPGIPCIFWEHMFDWGDDMRKTLLNLSEIRRRNGIHSRSSISILKADHDLYVADIDGKVRVKLGPRHDIGDLAPKDGWKISATGHDFAVWEKTA